MGERWVPLLLVYVGVYPLLPTRTVADPKVPVLKAFQPPHIEAKIGHPATLTCVFNYSGDQDDKMKFGKFYTAKHLERDHINTGVKCKHSSCELSHTINETSLKDENVYYCEVWIPGPHGAVQFNGTGTKLSLHVEPSSIEIQAPSPLVSGHEGTLLCLASGFYPQSASVVWFHGDLRVSHSSITTDISKDSDGTVSLNSQYRFIPTEADHTAECLCQISHSAWTLQRNATITLNISYGPSSVTVNSESYPVTNGSVSLTKGSPLNLRCIANGNPSPKIWWLGGNFSVTDRSENIHITAVRREHEGFYWCVAKNQYGERNSSITVLVSGTKEDDSAETADSGGDNKLYVLVVIPVALVFTIVIIIALQRKCKKKNNESHQGFEPDNHVSSHEGLTPPQAGDIYAQPKRHKKKPPRQRPAGNSLDETQLVYADIILPLAPRDVATTSETVYSEVRKERGCAADGRAQEEALSSIYTLARLPQ